ncbi:MAG: AI-2E family transporter [Parvularculaceae bacterium]|nr:AI-2E family transporter [Parvularculaceae bacterium]
MTSGTGDDAARPAPLPVTARGAAQLFYGLGLTVLLIAVAYFGRSVFIPLIVACFLSFIIYTLKETIRRGPLIGRFLPHWVCYIFAFALIISTFVLLIEIVRNNVDALIAAAPDYERRLRDISRDGIKFLKESGLLPAELAGGVDELRSAALSMINPILSQAGAVVRAITGNSVTIFLYTVFLLLERGRIFKKINLLSTDREQRSAVNETMRDIGTLVRQYITVKTVMNLITAAISYAIMRGIGVDFAGFWALLIFVFNFIPIVGAISAISLPVILSLVQPEGGGVQTALLALALLVGAEQAMSSGIEPRLVGKSLNLSPLVILISLAVWGTVWGFAGMLLAVPITVTIMIILTQFQSTRAIAILLSDSGEIAPINHAPLTPSASKA